MRDWSVVVEPEGAGPAFVRIARALSDDIRRGRLRAGDELPGSRTLATTLGVHRNTVLAAYRELAAEGWIDFEKARGTFVSPSIPEVAPRRFAPKTAMAERTGFDLPRSRAMQDEALAELIERQSPAKAKMMSLGGGVPDVRLVPHDEIARAMRAIMKRRPTDVLAYGDPQGPPSLRRALAEMVSKTRGVAAGPENVIVTRGSQMGIDLVARTLIEPGDVVAVEALGYRPAWEALRAAGARLVPLPVDAHGVDPEALDRLAKSSPVRGVYVTPHHQYPTTVTMAPARRLRLLEVARVHRCFLLEDDYDHEFHYDGRPVFPLASSDGHGVVVYIGTLSKVLAPGMRIGFVVVPAPLATRLATTRRFVDRQGDHLLEEAIAELLNEGIIQRHVRRARRVYAERREHLAQLLDKHFRGVLSFALPSGGTAIWAKSEVSTDAWTKTAEANGLLLQPGRQFSFDDKSRPYLRLGFAQHTLPEAKLAIARLLSSRPVSSRVVRAGSP